MKETLLTENYFQPKMKYTIKIFLFFFNFDKNRNTTEKPPSTKDETNFTNRKSLSTKDERDSQPFLKFSTLTEIKVSDRKAIFIYE